MSEPKKKSSVGFRCAVLVTILFLVLSAYAGAYLLMVEQTWLLTSFEGSSIPAYHSWPNIMPMRHPYFWEVFFSPAHSLDRRFRPWKWPASYSLPIHGPLHAVAE